MIFLFSDRFFPQSKICKGNKSVALVHQLKREKSTYFEKARKRSRNTFSRRGIGFLFFRDKNFAIM